MERCDGCQAKESHTQCRMSITWLLSLMEIFSQAIPEPTSSQFLTNYTGSPQSWTLGNLVAVSEGTFTIMPKSNEGNRTFLIDSLEALLIEPTTSTPSLFSLLLAYLQSANSSWLLDLEDPGISSDLCCLKEVTVQLQDYYMTKSKLNIFLQNTLLIGYVYQIKNKMVFLVDDLDQPRLIYAVPICKILSYQACEMPV